MEHLCNFIGTYDKRDHSFNDHLENEKNPESREKGVPSYEGERTAREGPSARDYVAKFANEGT